MKTVVQIANARAQALLRRFNEESVPPLTATGDLEAKTHSFAYGGGHLGKLPRRRSPVIWYKNTKHATSLWVPANYGSYRSAYKAFIKHIYGDDVDFSGFGTLDVDHVFNRARAPGAFLLRVEAVPDVINQAHGRGFEKKNTSSIVEESRKAGGKDHRKMTYISALKLANLDAPKSPQDLHQINAIKSYFRSQGWSPHLIQQALDNLLEVAARR